MYWRKKNFTWPVFFGQKPLTFSEKNIKVDYFKMQNVIFFVIVCVAYCLSFILCIIALFCQFYMQRRFCTYDFIMKLCFCFLCFKAPFGSLTLFLDCKITWASLLFYIIMLYTIAHLGLVLFKLSCFVCTMYMNNA